MSDECGGAMYTSAEPVKCWCGGGEGCRARINISNSKAFVGRHEYVQCWTHRYCVHCGRLATAPQPAPEPVTPPRS